MAKSLKTRLESKKNMVLRDVRLFGLTFAMNKYEVSDFTAFKRWVGEESGDAECGVIPVFNISNHSTLGEQIVAAFLQKLDSLQNEIAQLSNENKELEQILSENQANEIQQAWVALRLMGEVTPNNK